MTFSGEFETHLTVSEKGAAEFAAEHGLKFTHIVLDRGDSVSQPMLTYTGHGTLDEQRALAYRWVEAVRRAGMVDYRVKIEAAPWNEGVPQTDAAAADDPPQRYFEHHVKLRLPDADVARLITLTELVMPYGARLSRNARRRTSDGEERFVTQRCHRVGRPTARARLDELIAALSEYEVLEVEEEYVVHDTSLGLDQGWLTARDGHVPQPAEEPDSEYPRTYRPLPAGDGVKQLQVFDPSMKHFVRAFRAGEPEFADAEQGERWRAARRAAMDHVLAVVAASSAAKNLVVRGSITMSAWFGDAAREPGDVDFIVLPLKPFHRHPQGVLDVVVDAVKASPGAGVLAERVVREGIWTYERVPGQRLVFPFEVPGLPPGIVQLDFVFGERLQVPPAELELRPGTVMLAATRELSLAWKLLWLETDMYPQGKDLYDAVLLAEATPISRDLVVEVLRPELGREAESFTAESVLAWDVDWPNFVDEYPSVTGDVAHWQHRLALALRSSFE
ncbi:Nucleotidyl transferase AbiEii toxin, Type IV TA system [Amycolatopsis xylanica]|uniref:Nucleotidyl transferase AbiEii toxin, Type IV TA system n=1 Tax=Amycolatopsis xylanica TaxID=589385 RepID=A0A1H2YNA0_9PSEU|nr:nucleotidyl transferase AbiEii/AbiGii toxin family protein [Amycolatopsis xylanica]SDX06278.1 Nucleotidyl transferase AbiEii toxin, Type IV TA system [Amycolatopsis xylanica]